MAGNTTSNTMQGNQKPQEKRSKFEPTRPATIEDLNRSIMERDKAARAEADKKSGNMSPDQKANQERVAQSENRKGSQR